MSPERRKIVEYVETASELAESVLKDSKVKGHRLSTGTMTKLGAFYAAARKMQALLDVIEKDKMSIN